MKLNNRRHHFWAGMLFFILTLMLSGCGGGGGGGDDSEDTSSQETVTLSAEKLAGTGGKILYKGVEYTDNVTVPKNSLVGVGKDDHVYLYNPELGDVELSEKTTQKAVAYFILGIDQPGSTVTGIANENDCLTSLAVDSVNTIDINDSVELATKISIERDGTNVHINNNANRWAAVKITINNDTQIYFLPPRARKLDSNMSRWLATEQSTLFKDMPYAEDWLKRFNTDSSLNITIDKPATIETYGAVFRALPLYALRSPFGGDWPAGADESWNSDHELVLVLNTIDLYFVLLEGVKNILQLVPFSCFDVFTGAFMNMVEAEFLRYMADQDRIAQEWYRVLKEDIKNSMANCLLILPTALTWEVFTTFWTIASVVDYTVEDIVVQDSVYLNAAAYDASEIKDFSLAVSFSEAPSGLISGETGTWSVVVTGGTPPYNVTFDFGDGGTNNVSTGGASASSNHMYESDGSYTVKVTATDAANDARQVSSVVKVVKTVPEMLDVSFSSAPSSIEINQSGTWSIVVSSALSPIYATFDWGDGKKSTVSGSGPALSQSHAYKTEGDYTVKASVTDANDNFGQAEAGVEVTGSQAGDCINIAGRWMVSVITDFTCDSHSDTATTPETPVIVNQLGCDIDLDGGMDGAVADDQVTLNAPVNFNNMTKTIQLKGTATGNSIILHGSATFNDPMETCDFTYTYIFSR